MRPAGFISLIGLVTASALAAAETQPVRLMPAAAEVRWGPPLNVNGGGILLLSEQATPTERYAAQLLQRQIKRRLGQDWAIQAPKEPARRAGIQIWLGRPEALHALDRLCNEHSLQVPKDADGYALGVWSQGDLVTVAVAGSNERGVVYGQDTLFQLIGRKDNDLTVQAATIRDWPTIPMRGRPHPHYQYFQKAENLDCVMTSRINFIDLRDGIYAFEPDAKINRDELGKVVAEARRRGLIVFAVVNCGVPASQHEAVLGLFKEFLDLGANALWLSFDDKGPGAAPREIVAKVLALGRERGITGDRIAITPPKGSYQTIKMPFNRQIAAVPGMEQALWYWTSIPCAEDAADAQSIGLKVRPSWWHNWPRFREGALYSGGDRAYSPVFSLAEGWNHPTDAELTDAGKYVHAVLPWDGTQAQQHYVVPVIGWWAWRPEGYDPAALQARIYDTVFGPQRARSASEGANSAKLAPSASEGSPAQFDAGLDHIYRHFQWSVTQTDFAPKCPPRLRSVDDRAQVAADLKALQKLVSELRENTSGSLLDPELLQHDYLAPMQREVEAGLAAATAPYPEYWWHEHQARVLNAIYDGNTAKADELIAGARERVLGDISEVERVLRNLTATREYADWWRQRAAMSAADWGQLIAKRKDELKARVADYGKVIARTDAMLKGLDDPPVQFGTGAWRRHNHVLATVLPDDREQFWGDWIGGTYQKGDQRATIFALSRHLPADESAFSELPLNIPVPASCRRDRLALLVYVADANKESFGLGYAKWRWAESRSLRLLWNDREVWKCDIGIHRLAGEWIVVPLSKLPDDLKTLPLRMRVEDYTNAKNNFEIVYVGPVRLLELDRD